MSFFSYKEPKPGKGVSKDDPEERGAFKFFSIYFSRFWRLCQANLLHFLVGILFITKGLAQLGLTQITRSISKQREVFLKSDFFDAIKNNWGRGLIISVINFFVTFFLSFDILWFSGYLSKILGFVFKGSIIAAYWEPAIKGLNGTLIVISLSVLLVIFTFMKYYTYYLAITFQLPIIKTYKNALILAIMGLPRNILITVFEAANLGFIILLIGELGGTIGPWLAFFYYLFIFSSLRDMIIQYNIFFPIKKYMIDPYYETHPNEDKTLRYEIGALDIDDIEKEESVFKDFVDKK